MYAVQDILEKKEEVLEMFLFSCHELKMLELR